MNKIQNELNGKISEINKQINDGVVSCGYGMNQIQNEISNYLFCGCAYHREEPKRTDCYHYMEEHDMGATVHCCRVHSGYGNCPCTADCKDYIKDSDAYKVVRVWQAGNIDVKRTAKPERTVTGVIVCGECGDELDYKQKYCKNCGAKLDWSE